MIVRGGCLGSGFEFLRRVSGDCCHAGEFETVSGLETLVDSPWKQHRLLDSLCI